MVYQQFHRYDLQLRLGLCNQLCPGVCDQGCAKSSFDFYENLYDYGLLLEEELFRFGSLSLSKWPDGSHFAFS